MPRVTLIFAVLFIILGVIGYVGDSGPASQGPNTEQESPVDNATDVDRTGTTQKRSITALIPAATGLLLLLCGGLATVENWRKHAMHAAVFVAFLGLLAAGGRSATGLIKLAAGDDVNGRSLLFVCAMALLCAVFVAMCINSFIQARRARQTEQSSVQG